ncbi:MAG: LytTR family DNA-binding domain-containing protein [Balneolaceae bacterium]
MKLKCLIVDDEALAQNIIERYIEQVNELTLVAKCIDAVGAINSLNEGSIDLIFLDIEMPKLDGLSFLKTLKNPPKIILTTAYRKYAIEGFELDVVDYLLKPISFERFIKSVNKVINLKSLEENVNPSSKDVEADYIYLRADNKMIQIPFEDILYIQSLSNYVRIFRNGRSIISYQKLSHLEKVLPSSRFIRVHRSYIVPLHRISSYTNSYLEIGEEEIPLGGQYKDKVIEVLKSFEA